MKLRNKIKERLDDFERVGIIERSDSPWNSPLFAREKPNGDIRLVLDATSINAITKPIDYPLVNIDSLLARLHGYKLFSVLDLESGFYQIPLHPDSRQYFAFRVPWGKYNFCRLPMGASNSGFFFQAAMERILQGIVGKGVEVFQDDILIASCNIKDHILLLSNVLERFNQAGVKVKISKCNLLKRKIKFLGHVLSENSIQPDPEKVAAIKDLQSPRTLKGVRALLGKINFYAKFIPNVSEIALPITCLLTKGQGKIKWTTEAENALQVLKQRLCEQPVLKLPDYNQQFYLNSYYSNNTIACVVEQEHDNLMHPIGYYSRKLKCSEVNYTNVEKSALSVVAGLDNFRPIIYGYPLTIISGAKSLEYLVGLRDGNSRLSSWSTKILKYAPFLSTMDKREQNWSDILLNEEIKLNEDITTCDNISTTESMVTEVFTDGCCLNNGKKDACSGLGVFWGKDNPFNVSCAIEGRHSNNRSEILAACLAVTTAIARGIKNLIVYTDSDYVVNCVTKYMTKWYMDEWKTCRGKPIANENEFKLLYHLSKSINIKWIHVKGHTGIGGNEQANKLANEGATQGSHNSLVEYIRILSGNHEDNSPKSILAARTLEVKHIPKLTFERIKEYQDLDKELMKIRNEMGNTEPVFMREGIRMYSHPNGLIYATGTIKLKKNLAIDINAPYIPLPLRHSALQSCHDTPWAGHGGYIPTCINVLSLFFWASFRSDVLQHIRICDGCQRSNEIKRRAPILDFRKPQAPFEYISLDLVGPLIGTQSGNKYILNIIDLFSRYLVSVPLPDQKSQTISRGIETELIAKFGCPKMILTDRGANLRSEHTENVLKILGIKHNITGPYRPQTNGGVERVNREVKRKLTHLSQSSNNKWDELLPYSTFAYNNSYNRSIGRSPNEIIFGRRFNIPSVFIDIETDLGLEIQKDDYFKDLSEKLDHIRKETVDCDNKSTKDRLRYGNKKRKLIEFEIEDLLLYRFYPKGKNKKFGFKYKFNGPYKIVKKVSPVSYDIVDARYPKSSRIIRAHIDRLKKYYPPTDFGKANDDTSRDNDVDQSNNEDGCTDADDDSDNPAWYNYNHLPKVDHRGNERIRPSSDGIGPNDINVSGQGSEESREVPSGRYFTRSKGEVNDDIYQRYKFNRGNVTEVQKPV